MHDPKTCDAECAPYAVSMHGTNLQCKSMTSSKLHLSNWIAAIIPHLSSRFSSLAFDSSQQSNAEMIGFSPLLYVTSQGALLCSLKSSPSSLLSFIVRQPFDFTRLELTENHLLLTSPFDTLETFTLQSHEPIYL